MGCGDLSDAEWDLIGPLLPPERGRWARPAGDNRRFLNGMLHVLRVGCPWRDMHERYGKWNSAYVRFRRRAEQGVRGSTGGGTFRRLPVLEVRLRHGCHKRRALVQAGRPWKHVEGPATCRSDGGSSP